MVIKTTQLGKKGITDNFVETLKTYFNTDCQTVKISVLKSIRDSKQQVRELSQELQTKLGANYTTKTIGFIIIVKKWRKPRQ